MRARAITVVVVLGALVALGSAVGFGARTGGGAWIDAPLDGTVIEPGVISIIGHASHPDGIVELRLDVDGTTTATQAATGGTLETGVFEWTATPPGDHGLSVWGRTAAGAWIGPGVAVVTVLGAEECEFAKPKGTAPPNGAAVVAAVGTTLKWNHDGCREPSFYRVQVSVGPGFTADELVIDQATDQKSFDTGPLQPCFVYYWRVRPGDDLGVGPWSSVRDFTTVVRGCP